MLYKALNLFGVFLFVTAIYAPCVRPKHHPKHHHVSAQWKYHQTGTASFYACLSSEDCPWGSDNLQGKLTASGVPMDSHKAMCASWRFPLHTWVIIKDVRTHKSTACQIMDFGPNLWTHRIVDVSVSVKKAIGMRGGLDQVIVYSKAKPELVANAF